MLIASDSVIIRMDTQTISKFGRVTKGVRLMRLADDVTIVGSAIVEKNEETENTEENDTNTAVNEEVIENGNE